MNHQSLEQISEIETAARKEYSVVIDGVIAIPENLNHSVFFDGLFDAILEFVDKYEARAALSVTHQPYVESPDTETDDGEETA